ncbi:hypothetical protein C2U71_26770 [Burkholderia ubonensis]|nr:hypothetical protein C2U71_26770 [Burkholderia ubonensis]
MEPFTKDIAECFETPAIDVIARVDQANPARDAASPDELAQLRFFRRATWRASSSMHHRPSNRQPDRFPA